MLVKNPNKVFAIDLSENQIACTELKIAGYKYLDYQECMEFIGVRMYGIYWCFQL